MAVIGTGPAGLALAAASGRAGLRAVCVGPAPSEPWRRSFGVWEGEIDARLVEARWERPLVWPRAGEPRVVGRPYLRLSVPALQRSLAEALAAAGVEHVPGTVGGLEHDGRGAVLHLVEAPAVRARVAVDASGPHSPFVERAPGPPPAWQAAYGELVEVDAHPYRHGEMALMDYRPAGDDAGGGPSFLYALPLGPRLVFFEETSLAARPALPLAELRRRLAVRLARMRVTVRTVRDREWCLIPMGLALPHLGQRTVAFGAAASFVHPATGYQLARALRLAEPVARALAAGLGSGGPVAAARRAYAAMWPRRDRRSWALMRYGMEVLARLDRAGLADFFEAFFALPSERALGVLAGTLAPRHVLGAMWRLYRAAPPGLRAELLGGGTGPRAHDLWRAALAVSP
ncbi:MAG: lycopene cyclase family protein [Polyangiaceae bacterium]|nr:lycopene cyclase family protein [Polyangiaceae bacterium]